MAEFRKSELISGTFIVVSIAVFGLFAFKVGGFNPFGALRGRSVTFRAFFTDVKTLDVGAKVTVGGRSVGTCTGLSFTSRPTPEGNRVRQIVRVDFEVYDPTLTIDLDTAYVALAQDGFLGPHHLRLDPGTWPKGKAPPPLFEAGFKHGQVIKTRTGTGLEGVLEEVQPMLGNLSRLIAKIDNQVLSTSNLETTDKLLKELSEASTSLRELLDRKQPTGIWASLVEPVQKLVTNLDSSVDEVKQQLVGVTLVRANELLAKGNGLVDSANKAVSDLDHLIADNRPRVSAALDSLKAVTEDLGKQLDKVQSAVTGVISDNRAELAETVRRLRRTMWEAELAMRKIRANPAYLLFGDSEPDLEQRDIDLSGIRRSGRARPYQQRDESDK